MVGTNSRLDELQAGLLRVKLRHLAELTAEREQIALKYCRGIKNELLLLPEVAPGATHVWHLFVIRTKRRERLAEYLKDHGIGGQIHYPIPPHLSEAYAYLQLSKGTYLPISELYASEVLTLPLYNGMTESESDYVIERLNNLGCEMMKLRALEVKDIPYMLEWMKDKELAQFYRFDAEKSNPETAREFIERAKESKQDLHFAIVDEQDEYLGTASLKNVDYVNKNAEYAIAVCAKGDWPEDCPGCG